MKNIFKQILIKLLNHQKGRPLENNGERIEINLRKHFGFEGLDIYQKSHFKRYEFAKLAIVNNEVCGDFACGTGYGSILVSEKALKVIGVDIDKNVIQKISKRYKKNEKVKFVASDLLNLKYSDQFDVIISFETIEHFTEINIQYLFRIFSDALKKNGRLIFSTPYMQQQTKEAIAMGHHLTYDINELKIQQWLSAVGLKIISINYQNYITHVIEENLETKDFIICIAGKS